MNRRIVALLCLVALWVLMLLPSVASAAEPLDVDAKASLKLHYQYDGAAFSGLPIRIYRIAEAHPDGTFELQEPYTTYPINIHGITVQEQWEDVAQTLSAYIEADQVQPEREGLTDEEGTVFFGDLKTGLYLVQEVIAENNAGVCYFRQFLIYLPSWEQEGTYRYDMEANPKCTGFAPKTEYTVTKLWQDEGKTEDRPREVVVRIYKDGALYDARTLTAENQWSYTWYVDEGDTSLWTVVEESVPAQYTVTIQRNGNVFSLINTHRELTPRPPQTGDSFAPMPWIAAVCLSGLVLVSFGVYGRKRA